jgi:hypothetical protein
MLDASLPFAIGLFIGALGGVAAMALAAAGEIRPRAERVPRQQ